MDEPFRIEAGEREQKEQGLVAGKVHQPGIGFPAATRQKHLLIVRLNLELPPAGGVAAARAGLAKLCGLFARIDRGQKTIDVIEAGQLVTRRLSDYAFSATLGFGAGFFQTLGVDAARRPRGIRAMPTARQLGDPSAYSLGQTDLILQLGSSEAFINRWVLENGPATGGGEEAEDVVTAIAGWAGITDVHAGFQRPDGRNLQGFNDGVSNPRRLSPLFDRLVWSTGAEEPAPLAGGTYLVFQKVVHDLDQWRALDVEEQEEWVGRMRRTGLLRGTLSGEEDERLAREMASPDPVVQKAARAKWQALFEAQSDPQARLFDHQGGDPNGEPLHAEIPRKCPAWAHVRKANPRAEDGKVPERLIFRRGYPFVEPGPDGRERSGLLFVCFQKDLANGFEQVKKFLNSHDFPVPSVRGFTQLEIEERHRRGRFTVAALSAMTPGERVLCGLRSEEAFEEALEEAAEESALSSGREGLAGPTENGVIDSGTSLSTVTLGGGYYFVPPIPDRDMAKIGQQFFP